MLALLALLMLSITQDAMAQRNDQRLRRRHPVHRVVVHPARVRRAAVLVELPHDNVRIVVGRDEYFYSRGVYYRTGPHGYVTIAAPLGARVRFLPEGYTTVMIGGGPFFFYYGTYYQQDPVTKEYVVVNPNGTANAPPPATFDRLNLVDGRTIDGTFAGASPDTISFNINGVVQNFPIEQIVTIAFAPPSAPPQQ